VKKSFNIQELFHSKSKSHGTKPMHTSSLTAFQRHQEHDLKHPRFVDLITTKQNKTNYLSFIDRYPLEINKSQFLKMALGPVIQKVITGYITLKLYL
jgi:hypothetical protein